MGNNGKEMEAVMLNDLAETIETMEACAIHLERVSEERGVRELWLDITAIRSCVDYLDGMSESIDAKGAKKKRKKRKAPSEEGVACTVRL